MGVRVTERVSIKDLDKTDSNVNEFENVGRGREISCPSWIIVVRIMHRLVPRGQDTELMVERDRTRTGSDTFPEIHGKRQR